MVQAMRSFCGRGAALLLAAGVLLLGCSAEAPLESGTASGPRIVAKLASTAQLTELSRVVLTVEGEGVEIPPEIVEVSGPGRIFAFEVEVPVGVELTFTVRAEDTQGKVVYEGSTTTVVEMGGGVDVQQEIAILAAPTVPALVVAPSDTTVSQGATFEVAVDVYEVEALFGAAFELEYDGRLLEVDGAAVGDFLGADVLELVQEEEGRVVVAVVKKRGAAGESGSGRLARIPFRATAAGTSTLRIIQETLTLQRADGSAIANRGALMVGEGRVVVQ